MEYTKRQSLSLLILSWASKLLVLSSIVCLYLHDIFTMYAKFKQETLDN